MMDLNRIQNWTLALVAAGALGTTLLLAPPPAQAGSYDIVLRALGRPDSTTDANDPATARFRNLTSELALALAPRVLSPAETLGISGFEFSFATVHADISEDASYWQGHSGAPLFEGGATGADTPGSLWIPTIHIRKGLPLSTELGVTTSYLAFSRMFMLGAEAKVAIHESYWRWFPSIAARTSIASLFGNSELKMTTAELTVLASLPFGIDGVIQLTPYLGYGALFDDVTSGVIDETPYSVTDPVNDQRGGVAGSLYTFKRMEWHTNLTHRFVVGTRLKFAFVEVTYELDVGHIAFSGKTLQSHALKFGFDT